MFPINLTNFSEIFSYGNLIFLIIFSLGNGVFLYFASIKCVLSLQQSNYKSSRYIKWLAHPHTLYLSRLMLLCLLGFLFFCVLNMCFATLVGETATSYVGFAAYILFVALYINSETSVNAKVPLKITKRLVRLIVVYMLLLSVATFGFMILLDFLSFSIGERVVAILRYSLVCVLPILSPYILLVANSLLFPFERSLNKYYVKVATNKLDNLSIIKIGITGSFGKTSVKEILATILSQKYRVLATPKSFNTPLGVALSVKKLDSTHDVFIAEMGARNKGDIKEIAKMVKPSIGVLTGVNSQHLESFKTIENTMATKNELFENLTEGGLGFFSSDNAHSIELYNKFEGEKYFGGIDGINNSVYATDIETTERGTMFTLNVKGEEPVKCNTVLLGRHSVSNICLASAVAYKIGMTVEEIVTGISRISSVGHRLELMPNNKGIVIIDDSYNSNPDGIDAAMEVFDRFNGRKIVLTPGMVELGKEENAANYEFGKLLSSHADLVFVIGKHNAEMLIKGMLDGGMKKENIRFAKTLNKGNIALNEELKSGDVVLFENDLPDNYS